MKTQPKSPRIDHISWGKIVVEGYGTFKDAKLFPGGAREWDWKETGTRHKPGIQFSDVEELIENNARAIVLATGMNEYLRVTPETLAALSDLDIQVHVLQTKKAVELYNQLLVEENVGALIHSTC